MEDAVVRYIHFIAIIAFSAGLVVEQFLIAKQVTAKEIRTLANADALCGVSAILVLASGLVLWFVVGKPAEFYSNNELFHIKLGLLITIVALAIQPALFFARNRNSQQAQTIIPNLIVIQLRLELALLFVVPLMAVLMARGYGFG